MVKQARQSSSRETTRRLADIPYLFGEIRQPNSEYILIPSVSSENRRYIPIGYMSADVIGSNLVLFVPNASRFHFGVLTSTMHNAWMRQVCGRLKSDYRYSNNLVYNNFPWPQMFISTDGGNTTGRECAPSHAQGTLSTGRVSASYADDKKRLRVEKTAQGILDARLKFPDSTLADLYDPLSMPKELLDAHRANDEAVDACYGTRRFKIELERLEFLFDLYRQYTEPLAMVEEKETRKAKRRPSLWEFMRCKKYLKKGPMTI